MKKCNVFMAFIAVFMLVMTFSAFNTEVAAQSKEDNIQNLVNSLKDEFPNNEGFDVRSVTVVDNTAVIDVVSLLVPAELACEIMRAFKSYMNDNDVQLPLEGKEFVDAFNSAGCKGVLIKVYDAGSNKSNNVNLTAKEFATFSCMGDISNNSQAMMGVMSYLPVEDFVKIMDAGVKDESKGEGGVVLEKNVIFFVMNVPADEFLQVKQAEEMYPGAMKEIMKKQITENPDPSVALIVEIARKHGCNFGFKFTASGQKPLMVVLD